MKLHLNKKDSTEEDSLTLKLDTYYDEMLKTILDRFNDFRGPDEQIISLYNQYGQEIPLTFRVKSDLTLFYACGTLDTKESLESDDVQSK